MSGPACIGSSQAAARDTSVTELTKDGLPGPRLARERGLFSWIGSMLSPYNPMNKVRDSINGDLINRAKPAKRR